MTSAKWLTLTCAILTAAWAPTGTAHAAEVNEVIEIAGNTVTNEVITSFGMQLEYNEGSRYAEANELLNEYILTRLYDKIPTTATLPQADEIDSPSPYPQSSQRTLLRRELMNWIAEKVEVPREEMEQWHAANADRYSKPEKVHAWHIFKETSEDNPSSSTATVKAALAEIKAKADAGTSFSLLAKTESEAASGELGGEIGLINRRMPIGPLSKPMNIELEEQFFSLPVGKVSDIVETRHGMHLLFVSHRETTHTPTLDDMITSGILPGALTQDHVTSNIQALIASTIEKHKAESLPGGEDLEELTSNTVAFVIDGRQYTIDHLREMFGPRFSSYLDSVRGDSSAIRDLMRQAMEDEISIIAAVDNGLDKAPQLAAQLRDIGQREKAIKRINAITAAEVTITEEEILAQYEDLRDDLRQSEAEGQLILVKSAITSGTAEQARAREMARRKAEILHTQLTSATTDLAAVINAMPEDNDGTAIILHDVPVHVVGRTTESIGRTFDQAIGGLREPGEISRVINSGSDFAIARLGQRLPGEPTPLETIRPRIESMLRSNYEQQVRDDLIHRLEEQNLIKYLPGAKAYGKEETTN